MHAMLMAHSPSDLWAPAHPFILTGPTGDPRQPMEGGGKMYDWTRPGRAWSTAGLALIEWKPCLVYLQDVYSYGVVLWELLSWEEPWGSARNPWQVGLCSHMHLFALVCTSSRMMQWDLLGVSDFEGPLL